MIKLKNLIFENKIEKLQYPLIQKNGYSIMGYHSPEIFQLGKYYSDGDVLNYIKGQHNEFEDDDGVDGVFMCLEMNPNDIEESEWNVDDDKIGQLSQSKKVFPPIVLNSRGSVIDGGHRLAAAKLRRDSKIKVLKQI